MNQKLKDLGFIKIKFPYAHELHPFVIEENFKELDLFLLKEFLPTGRYFQFFQDYFPVNSIEHIIAMRLAPHDEDGIWHDDGSRLYGFSLSLNLLPESIVGGELLFKAKDNTETTTFPPLPFGELVIFLTGEFGFEHKVCQVTAGKRLVIAGWGSK